MSSFGRRLLLASNKGLILTLGFLFSLFVFSQSIRAAEFNVGAGDTAVLINSINSANSNSETDTINLTAGTYELTTINNNTYSNSGLPVINSEIIINGNGATIIRNFIDNFRIFTILDSGKLTLENISIENGSNNDGNGGGAIWIGDNSSIKIMQSKIINNNVYHPGSGGAIQKRGSGNVEIIDSEISNNYAQNTAGALYAYHTGEVIIKNSTFNNNSTDDSGGAIRNYAGKLTIENSTFSNNRVLVASYGLGGAIGNESGGQINISYSTFNNNFAANNGGFIYTNGTASINHSCINGNSNTAVYNTAPSISATSNFWGSSDGPSGAGPGTGDSISANVDYLPFLTECPEAPPPPPPPPAEKLPIVLLPGLGASMNLENLISNTSGGVWKKTPFVKNYDNFRATFLTNGYSENDNYFEYYYDWRQPLDTLDDRFNDFINNTVLNGKPADTKVNLIGHSLGGLLARTWAQNFGSERINKLVTSGSPHEGAIPAYFAWAGGEAGEQFSLQWLLFQLALRLNLNLYSSPVSAIQGIAPGIKDILPIFDFTHGLPVTPTNTFLTDLKNNLPDGLITLTSAIFGHETDPAKDTVEFISLGERTIADKLLNRWSDGRPNGFEFTPNGDLTVLDKSAILAGADPTGIDAQHDQLLETGPGIQAILDALNISGIAPVTGTVSPEPIPSLFFFLHSPANLKVTGPDSAEYFSDEDKLLLIAPAEAGDYRLEVLGTGDGLYRLEIAQLTDAENAWYTLADSITTGATDTFTLKFNPTDPLADPIPDPTGQTKLAQAKLRLDQLKKSLNWHHHFYLNTMIKLMDKRPLGSLEMVYGLSRNPRIAFTEIDAIGQLILESYVVSGRDRLSQKFIEREIQQTERLKTKAEKRLENLTGRPRLGLMLELAEESLDRAKNTPDRQRAHANLLIARTLLWQLI